MRIPMAVVAIISLLCLAGCDSSPPLPVTVDLEGGILSVRNIGKVDLDECVINLNSDWRLWKVAIRAGQTGRYPVQEFTSGDVRFNPYTHKISNIIVQCFRPTGSAFFG